MVYFVARFGPFCGVVWYPFSGGFWYTLSYHLHKWSEDAKNRYFSILRQADSVIYVSRNYYKDCMLDRNRFMVDHASILLAVYNGEKRGGTAATVNYAKKMKREIIAIDPFSHEAVHLFNP